MVELFSDYVKLLASISEYMWCGPYTWHCYFSLVFVIISVVTFDSLHNDNGDLDSMTAGIGVSFALPFLLYATLMVFLLVLPFGLAILLPIGCGALFHLMLKKRKGPDKPSLSQPSKVL